MIAEIVHELIFDPNFPKDYKSDLSKVAWFAREHNISLEELLNGLLKHAAVYQDEESWNKWAVKALTDAVNKGIKAKNRLVGNTPNLLDTKMTGGGYEYAATIKKEVSTFNPHGKYVVNFVQKRTDDDKGTMTGVPNAEYWDGTPGQYYASTLLGYDDAWNHRIGNSICIDGGTNWCIDGTSELADELERKFGDEIKQEVEEHNRQFNELMKKKERERLGMKESYRAKKVYENLKGE